MGIVSWFDVQSGWVLNYEELLSTYRKADAVFLDLRYCMSWAFCSPSTISFQPLHLSCFPHFLNAVPLMLRWKQEMAFSCICYTCACLGSVFAVGTVCICTYNLKDLFYKADALGPYGLQIHSLENRMRFHQYVLKITHVLQFVCPSHSVVGTLNLWKPQCIEVVNKTTAL